MVSLCCSQSAYLVSVDEDLFVSPFKFVILSHCATSFGDMTNLRESLGLNDRFLDWGAFAVPSFHIIGIDVSSQH